LAHVLKGESTVDELMRVVDIPQEEDGIEPPSAPGARGSVSGAAVSSVAPGTAVPPTGAAAAGGRGHGGLATPAASSAAQSEALTGNFELLEEPATPRLSWRHGGAAPKVLLVDDEDSLRKVMRDLLERDGYVVSEARDGVQALDQIDRVGPDIIVLDLNLPGLDGYGVLSHVRSRPATASIPVVVLTAKGDEDNEVRVFELGADDFLTKPFRARALSARLEAVLGRRR
ncbi:MAG TPA: response regulator, partial [Gemmatimonadales bacterium]